MNIFPGFGGSSPSAPAALPPPVKREDPQVIEAKNKLRLSEKRRKGRRSTILTSPRGIEQGLGAGAVEQPRAGASLLG